jgi:hypothetical protein
LAEGRVACADWLAWWQVHADELQRALLPGWFARLKPRHGERSPNETLAAAIAGASYMLTALQIEHSPEQRFAQAAQAEREAAVAAIRQRNQQRQGSFQPAIKAIGVAHPKFARLLARRSDLITNLGPAATDIELQSVEASLGLMLPAALMALLRASRCIELEGFRISADLLFRHESSPSAGWLCFADYFLEADGDQMLFSPRDLPADDPPVYYYAHGVPEIRPLGTSFSAWLESLGRSPLFRD